MTLDPKKNVRAGHRLFRKVFFDHSIGVEDVYRILAYNGYEDPRIAVVRVDTNEVVAKDLEPFMEGPKGYPAWMATTRYLAGMTIPEMREWAQTMEANR